MIYITIQNNYFVRSLRVVLSIVGSNRYIQMSKIHTNFATSIYLIEISNYSRYRPRPGKPKL
jgi:hypothetical protein